MDICVKIKFLPKMQSLSKYITDFCCMRVGVADGLAPIQVFPGLSVIDAVVWAIMTIGATSDLSPCASRVLV